jgi:hypothetical protein
VSSHSPVTAAILCTAILAISQSYGSHLLDSQSSEFQDTSDHVAFTANTQSPCFHSQPPIGIMGQPLTNFPSCGTLWGVKCIDGQPYNDCFDRNYLDWLTTIPWGVASEENLELSTAAKVLGEDSPFIEKHKLILHRKEKFIRVTIVRFFCVTCSFVVLLTKIASGSITSSIWSKRSCFWFYP